MSFTSVPFALFAVLSVILYYTAARKFQWQFLLAASLFFYACSDIRYLIFIVIVTGSAYFVTRRFTSLRAKQAEHLKSHPELTKDEKKAFRKKTGTACSRWLLAVVLLDFGILFAFKYLNFFITNINAIIGIFSKTASIATLNIILPLGISFYIFQTVGYVADVYFGKYEAEKNPFRLALFVSFFPQLIQGPIGRYDLMAPTLYARHEFDPRAVSSGVERMLFGYFKKIVVADRIAPAVAAICGAPDKYRGAMVAVGMLFYATQLWCDFTGGIDITIGIAETLGISLSENFNRPFFSKNIAEYWRRWHITLGTWFRDYTFYPLSTSKGMMKLTKATKKHFGSGAAKRVPVYLASAILWFATGAWHGAKWNFIVWGLLNCAVILISQELSPLYRKFAAKFPKLRASRFWDGVQVIRTNILMSFLRTFDCYATVGLAFSAMGSVFLKPGLGALTDGTLMNLGLTAYDYAVIAVSVILLFTVSMIQRSGSVREKMRKLPSPVRVGLFVLLFFVIIVFGAYGPGYNSGDFIYGQF
ncbi:MAG: MBOAT family protein [Firmicutes bacterium]|nr:MBOAT family protein [Bacillota bacterium]